MEKINVLISWSGDNYSATVSGEKVNGCIIVTNKTLDGVKKDFNEALEFHIEGCVKDGDEVAEWLQNHSYELNFDFDTLALLHSLDGVLTRAALSRATGINEKQLGHYASGHRKPRPNQREKIINGIHAISKELVFS
ncbi:MAG: CopG family transcriptional regulator [Prevotella sp.]|nr:CopG family transcriptional regulator [Prevotella sp.]